MTPSLTIRLLGAAEIRYGDRTLLPPTRKATLLFAYLVLHRQQPHERAFLAGLLWPDLPETRARRNLNTEIWRLRQALGEAASCLLITPSALAFDPPFPYTLDIEPLDHLPPRAPLEQLERAVENYRGDFLAGCYDDWVITAQEHLRASYLQALGQLMERACARADYSRALVYAHRIIEHEPLQESVHREIIEIHIRQGDRAAALRQYRQFAETLRRELGVAPMPETQTLYQSLLSTFPRGLPDVFAGREKELAVLDRFFAGKAKVLLLAGASGIGKTALVEAWSRTRLEPNCPLRVSCLPEASPYGPIADALRIILASRAYAPVERLSLSQRQELARILPELYTHFPDLEENPRLAPEQARERFFGAMLAAFQHCGETTLFLDDLHQAQPDTLALLQYLLQHLPPDLFRLLGAYQPGVVALHPEHPLCDWLELTPTRQILHLNPLTPAETGAVLQALAETAHPPSFLATWMFRESEGNPLFIVETLRGMFESGILVRSFTGGWALSVGRLEQEANLPPAAGIEAVIQARLSRLNRDTREFLELAAVLGTTFDYDWLLETSRQEEERLIDTLDLLLRASLLRKSENGLQFTFSHEKIRVVLYKGIPPSQRAYLHCRVAQALESLAAGQEDRFIEALAHHYSLSNRPAAALPYLQLAAEKAETLNAYQDALSWWGRALEISEGKRDTRLNTCFEIQMSRLRCLRFSGMLQEARAEAEAVVRLAEKLGEKCLARAKLFQGRNLIALGEWQVAEEALESAGRHARAAGEAAIESKSMLFSAILDYHVQREGLRAGKLHAALKLAKAAGDESTSLKIRLEIAANRPILRLRAEGLLEGFEEARRRNDFVVMNQFATSLIINVMHLGEYGRALQLGGELLILAREHGIATLKHSLGRMLSRCHNEIGNYREARALARESLHMCRTTGYRYGELRARACLATADAGLGHFEYAMPEFQQAMAMCEEVGANHEWLLFAFLTAEAWLWHPGEGALGHAERLAHKALQRAETVGHRRTKILAHTQLSRVYFRKGRATHSLAHSHQALKLMREHGHAIGREHHVWFAHAQALQAAEENGWIDALARARQITAQRAWAVPRGELRQGYLHNIPIHRHICAARG